MEGPTRLQLRTRRLGLIAGLSLPLVFGLSVDLQPGSPATTAAAAVALMMAVFWMTEALPLAATALIPLVAFPLLNIADTSTTAGAYINPTIFLFLGGFLIAQAMERWQLHRRIALLIIGWFSGRPVRVVWGFMLATAFLSMWLSNTATTVMMLPIALAVIDGVENEFGRARARGFAVALLLGVAYSASIGGMATLVGTPPNLALARIYQIQFPDLSPIAFNQWLLFGLPVAAVMLVLAGGVVTRLAGRIDRSLVLPAALLAQERRELGRMSAEERRVAGVFAATALLWIFRRSLDLGPVQIPGWSALLPASVQVDDSTVAIAMALLLFFLPASRGQGTRLLDVTAFGKLPWDIVILFGGGFALAKGFVESGLSGYLGEQLAGLHVLGKGPLTALLAAGMTTLTEMTSNTATTQMILPILAATAETIGVEPLALMVPATLSASFAFMLPVATPPNAIVFGSHRLSIFDMVRAGIWLNLLGLLVVVAMSLLLVPVVF